MSTKQVFASRTIPRHSSRQHHHLHYYCLPTPTVLSVSIRLFVLRCLQLRRKTDIRQGATRIVRPMHVRLLHNSDHEMQEYEMNSSELDIDRDTTSSSSLTDQDTIYSNNIPRGRRCRHCSLLSRTPQRRVPSPPSSSKPRTFPIHTNRTCWNPPFDARRRCNCCCWEERRARRRRMFRVCRGERRTSLIWRGLWRVLEGVRGKIGSRWSMLGRWSRWRRRRCAVVSAVARHERVEHCRCFVNGRCDSATIDEERDLDGRGRRAAD